MGIQQKLEEFQDQTVITMELLVKYGFVEQEKQPKTDKEWHLKFPNAVGTISTLTAKPSLGIIQWYIDHQPFPRQLCVNTLGRLRVICELLAIRLSEVPTSDKRISQPD